MASIALCRMSATSKKTSQVQATQEQPFMCNRQRATCTCQLLKAPCCDAWCCRLAMQRFNCIVRDSGNKQSNYCTVSAGACLGACAIVLHTCWGFQNSEAMKGAAHTHVHAGLACDATNPMPCPDKRHRVWQVQGAGRGYMHSPGTPFVAALAR